MLLPWDEESWQKSLYNWTYQVTGEYPDLEKRLQDYRNHKDFVMNYFKDRSKDEFLILDVRDEKGFKKLADFVGKSTDQLALPHFNKTQVAAKKKVTNQ